MQSPRLLGTLAAAGTHCLLPDDNVPFDVAYRRSEKKETSGRMVLRLRETSSRNLELSVLTIPVGVRTSPFSIAPGAKHAITPNYYRGKSEDSESAKKPKDISNYMSFQKSNSFTFPMNE